jgi:hypothetical protein
MGCTGCMGCVGCMGCMGCTGVMEGMEGMEGMGSMGRMGSMRVAVCGGWATAVTSPAELRADSNFGEAKPCEPKPKALRSAERGACHIRKEAAVWRVS